jgi:hypothetical protein
MLSKQRGTSIDLSATCGRSLPVTLVEPVVVPPWEHMLVEVPDVLVAIGFVVLAGRRAVAAVGGPHR